MVYTPNTEAQREEMLARIGVKGLDDLYREVPKSVRDRKIELPTPLPEPELIAEMRRLSEKNADAAHYATFLGAGAYNHFSPSAVYRIMSRSEFYTAYTPYQPEPEPGDVAADLRIPDARVPAYGHGRGERLYVRCGICRGRGGGDGGLYHQAQEGADFSEGSP